MKRRMTAELVDLAWPEPERLAESLADLAWLNRYFGGTATILHQLRKLIGDDSPGALRVLDVGAGGADILLAVKRWCEARGIEFEGLALELGRETARAAVRMLAVSGNRSGIEVVRGDARALPVGDRQVDVTFCSTFLHHLGRDDALVALKEMARVSAVGIVVSDLRRGRLGYLAAWALANSIWRGHSYTHHDATVSMRGAYTLAEARSLAAGAGLEVAMEPQLWFRWALRWRRPTC
jgi:2-polyprenyl-3-methyl-5-hydroxy-6-metoxy-1,4-benzoquinol methylase